MKKLPSSMSPDVYDALSECYGGYDCLLQINQTVVCKLMENIGDEDLI